MKGTWSCTPQRLYNQGRGEEETGTHPFQKRTLNLGYIYLHTYFLSLETSCLSRVPFSEQLKRPPFAKGLIQRLGGGGARLDLLPGSFDSDPSSGMSSP